MLAEFVNALVDLAKRANQVEFHTHPDLPNCVLVRNGDELETRMPPPPLRGHMLAGFDDLVAALSDPSIAPAPEVYVSPGQVYAFLDRADRREHVSVKLAESTRFKLVQWLQRPAAYHPRALVKLLRFDLHGGNVSHVIQAVSRIDFMRTSAGKTDVAHGKETLGRSVEAAVQQADAVPQTFTLALNPWTTQGFNRFGVQVEFSLYLDLEAQMIEVRVLADEVERVRNLALAAVVAELAGALPKVPIFLGEP